MISDHEYWLPDFLFACGLLLLYPVCRFIIWVHEYGKAVFSSLDHAYSYDPHHTIQMSQGERTIIRCNECGKVFYDA